MFGEVREERLRCFGHVQRRDGGCNEVGAARQEEKRKTQRKFMDAEDLCDRRC